MLWNNGVRVISCRFVLVIACYLHLFGGFLVGSLFVCDSLLIAWYWWLLFVATYACCLFLVLGDLLIGVLCCFRCFACLFCAVLVFCCLGCFRYLSGCFICLLCEFCCWLWVICFTDGFGCCWIVLLLLCVWF